MNESNAPILSIILPAYREKLNLEIFIPQIEAEFQDISHEIIIVDDHSEDGTRQLIESLHTSSPHIQLLERPGLLGIGSALRDGYNKAQGEFILSSDADLSFSTADMRRLLEKIQQGFDIVLGYRVPPPSENPTERHADSLKGWMENSIISPFFKLDDRRDQRDGVEELQYGFSDHSIFTLEAVEDEGEPTVFLVRDNFSGKAGGCPNGRDSGHVCSTEIWRIKSEFLQASVGVFREAGPNGLF
jgi:glycosyltransferase involved in cell wall biosynthesis